MYLPFTYKIFTILITVFVSRIFLICALVLLCASCPHPNGSSNDPPNTNPQNYVYMAGYYRDSQNNYTPCYWVNGEWTGVKDWQLTPDNNAGERGIRPFEMGRKNWVMSGSPAGDQSSCELYTLIETAKANNWNPAKYLTKIFQKAAAMKPSDDWSRLLPWNLAP
jgi:hypothetical protein